MYKQFLQTQNNSSKALSAYTNFKQMYLTINNKSNTKTNLVYMKQFKQTNIENHILLTSQLYQKTIIAYPKQFHQNTNDFITLNCIPKIIVPKILHNKRLPSSI